MPFEPRVGEILDIDGQHYTIAEHPAAPGVPYGQEGRAGVVYRLLAPPHGTDQALKVFKPRFRLPFLVSQAERIAAFASLPGLSACRRTVLTPSRHANLLRQHPDLTYAVLMPWIDGPTWQEILLSKKPLPPQQSLNLARSLADVLVRMEEQGIAHCDLSAPNLMLPALAQPPISKAQYHVELVDLEGLYAPNMLRPQELSSGSAGYAHRQAAGGLWSPDADRFAGAVLLAEILGFCDPQVVEACWGESYFDPQEMQQDSSRYRILVNSLRRNWGDGVAGLFEQAWHSDTLADCPTFGEWLIALPLSPRPVEEVPGKETDLTRAQVQALMQVAQQLEAQGNLEGALIVYRQAQTLVSTDPVLASLGWEIRLIVQDLEGRRQCKKMATPVPVPVQSLAPPVATIEQPKEAVAEESPRHRGIGWLWAIVSILVIMGMITTGLWLQQSTRVNTYVEAKQSITQPQTNVLTPTPTFTLTPTSTPTLTPTSTPTPTATPTPTPKPGPIIYFWESFDGSALNNSIWNVDIGSGNISLRNGVLTLSSSGRRYPYLRTNFNPFPLNGDFRATFRFRYFQALTCGVGIISNSYITPVGLSQEATAEFERQAEASGVAVGVWQDGSYGMQYWFRAASERKDIFLGINTGWNEMVIEYRRERYYMYLNGYLIYTSQPTKYRPNNIWIGHPAELSNDCLWSGLEIDSIVVETLP